jgi:hypothetical protein
MSEKKNWPLVDEIRSGFANVDSGQRAPLKETGNARAWVYRKASGHGVALLLPEPLDFIERYASAVLYVDEMAFPEGQRPVLRLENHREALRQQFAVLCAEFVFPGTDGVRRASLVGNPRGWWEQWRELLGNATRDTSPQTVLAELLTVEWAHGQGLDPEWRGPDSSSHDVQCSKHHFEVKSTLSRYQSKVEIAGQHQLNPVTGKQLDLAFWRFEPDAGDECINGVVARLEKQGCAVQPIEDRLRQMGYERGMSARSKGFAVLEAFRIPVDDAFPCITSSHFVGGTMPPHIEQFQYTVDLSGLPRTPIEPLPGAVFPK